MIARACAVPRDGLLDRYAQDAGVYTDCFEVMSVHEVDLAEFITAFYTTGLFRMERAILQVALRRRITDQQVAALASGADVFAAWRVEARASAEILLCDQIWQTRSYLAVSPKQGNVTRLVFGTAVVKSERRLVRVLGPLHRFYSKLLLRMAARRLNR